MNPSHDNNESQRFTSYRAVIPFYILYDLDLNANHLRLYGQIEQFESNPNPKVQATFSYAWLANELGMNKRNAMRVAKVLIDKGYIEHRQISEGRYIWNTKKAQVVVDEIDHPGCHSETGGSVTERHGGSVTERHPKIPKDKYPKDNTKPLVDFKKSTDYKDDKLFMTFYSQYPNKQKPEVARKAFYKHKPDQVFVDFLCNDIRSRMENNWKGRDKDKIPHPSTYLNSKEWEGEIYKIDQSTKLEKTGDSLSRVLDKYSKQQGAMYDEYGNSINTFC